MSDVEEDVEPAVSGVELEVSAEDEVFAVEEAVSVGDEVSVGGVEDAVLPAFGSTTFTVRVAMPVLPEASEA